MLIRFVLTQIHSSYFLGTERVLVRMSAGEERFVTIPWKLGYGSKGFGDRFLQIWDLDLVFEVKVLKVGKAWECILLC